MSEKKILERSRDTTLYHKPGDSLSFYALIADAGNQQAADGSWFKVDLYERWEWFQGTLSLMGTIHPDAATDLIAA